MIGLKRLTSSILTALLVLAVPIDLGAPRPVYADPAVDARIEIVWPHDEQGQEAPVGTARLVNVEAFLFERGTLNPASCDFPNRVVLRWSRNLASGRAGVSRLVPAHDLPGEPASAVGQRTTRTVGGRTFPVWVFNDVPTGLPTLPGIAVTTYFFVEVEGSDARTNVWAHTADVRTFLPEQRPPTMGIGTSAPAVVDALIAIVWPHDEAGNVRPVGAASGVNVGVDLAEHPATGGDFWRSIGPGRKRPVRLLRSLNDGPQEVVQQLTQPVIRTQQGGDGVTYSWPRWEFNDVDVAAARDPTNKYYFAVQVDGVPTHTTIWSHGADARTIFPQPDLPARSGANCE